MGVRSRPLEAASCFVALCSFRFHLLPASLPRPGAMQLRCPFLEFGSQAVVLETLRPNGGHCLRWEPFLHFWINRPSNSGAGTAADPYIYGHSDWYLSKQGGPPLLYCDSGLAYGCSDWQMSEMVGYYADPQTFLLTGTFTARFDPAFYLLQGLPIGESSGTRIAVPYS